MKQYEVRISKINSGINVTILNKGKLKDKEKIDCIFDAAHEWWRQQVMSINNLTEEWFKWKDNKTETWGDHTNGYKTFAYEPWGFAINGQMADTGSCPTGSRKETLEIYQSPFTMRGESSCIYFEKYLTIELDKHEKYSYIPVAKVIEVKEGK